MKNRVYGIGHPKAGQPVDAAAPKKAPKPAPAPVVEEVVEEEVVVEPMTADDDFKKKSKF